jgi:hypothetical protein
MGAGIRLEWRDTRTLLNGLDGYARRMEELPYQICTYFAPTVEGAAKEDAVWTDRTGNARQSLRGVAERLGKGAAALYLYHGMDYGKHLELKYQGRYAVIMATLERYYPEIQQMARDVLR